MDTIVGLPQVAAHLDQGETDQVFQGFVELVQLELAHSGELGQVTILGLENTEYIDKTDKGAHKLQTVTLTIDREVDRIYRDVSHELVIDDNVLDRRIHIASRGSRTAVVWNPWARISVEMGDLEDDDYERFVCVETANADLDVAEVAPGGEARLVASYRVERDVPEELKALHPED